MTIGLPAPVNTAGVGVVDEVVELVVVPLDGRKLAQVSRVVLLVCITMLRLPRKLPRPIWVDTYRSMYLREQDK